MAQARKGERGMSPVWSIPQLQNKRVAAYTTEV